MVNGAQTLNFASKTFKALRGKKRKKKGEKRKKRGKKERRGGKRKKEEKRRPIEGVATAGCRFFFFLSINE